MEAIIGLLMGLGGLIALIAWVWLVVVAFKEGGPIWGIVVLLFSWVGGLVFCIVKQTGWPQFALMIIGAVLATGGAFLSIPLMS